MKYVIHAFIEGRWTWIWETNSATLCMGEIRSLTQQGFAARYRKN